MIGLAPKRPPKLTVSPTSLPGTGMILTAVVLLLVVVMGGILFLRTSLPKTPSERVEKFKLKNEGITDDCWDREAAGIELQR